MRSRWRYYKKGMTAAFGALVITLPLVWDRHVTQTEAMTMLFAWGTAAGVYQTKNGT